MKIRVECHAGYRGAESPRIFFLGDRRIAVADILQQWRAPDYRYFKVRDGDDSVYILRHGESDDTWELTVFDRTGSIA